MAALGLLCLAPAGCSLVFSFEDAPDGPDLDEGRDAGPAAEVDAGRDAGLDAAVPIECGGGQGTTFEVQNCLGCGLSCGPMRPFCCLGTCCAEECGTIGNDCSRTLPAGDGDADADADADGDIDPGELPDLPDGGLSCEMPFETYEDCLGCGASCNAAFPFCCVGKCCAEECGSRPNACTTSP